jgi:signal transduction histidine kinase
VQERTAKLRETVADLEQFSYSIAHDLRAPLRTMCSFSSILLEDADRKFDAEALDYLRRIAAAAQRMDRLIQDVLNYSRVVRAEVNCLPTDLEHLINEVIEHYPQLAEHRAAIAIRRPLLPVLGNPVLLLQSISNFLENAVKFVPAGVQPKISVWTEERSGYVRFCVQDNGLGIDPLQVDRIWRLFERGPGQMQYTGTGIGLSLVKRAVERMGGTVGVETTLGQGSLFWFELARGTEG